jgi:hypothetical protein
VGSSRSWRTFSEASKAATPVDSHFGPMEAATKRVLCTMSVAIGPLKSDFTDTSVHRNRLHLISILRSGSQLRLLA